MIKVNCVNLKIRTDRKVHTENEFSGRDEFDMSIVAAIANKVGAIGLWKTLCAVVQEMQQQPDDYFIFCEDDHIFTDDYSFDFLYKNILEAQSLNADILLGGVSWFDIVVQARKNMFWVNNYSGNQFLIIFKKFYQTILNVTEFDLDFSADHMISLLTDKKFIIYPFISIQKEFGYSDATHINNQTGRVDYLFETTTKRLSLLNKIRTYYLP